MFIVDGWAKPSAKTRTFAELNVFHAKQTSAVDRKVLLVRGFQPRGEIKESEFSSGKNLVDKIASGKMIAERAFFEKLMLFVR